MRFRKWPIYALFSLGMLGPVAKSHATTVTYSTYNSWNSAVTGGTELNFSGISYGASYNTASGKTLTPIKGTALSFVFTGPYSSGYQLSGIEYGTNNSISFGGPTGGKGDITVTLPSGGENAILLGLGTVGSATSLSIALSDGEAFNVAATANSTEWFGVSLSHDISWITVSSSSQSVIDDFFFGSSKLTPDANATPGSVSVEGSTLALIGGGLLSMFGARRRIFPKSLTA